MKYIFVVALLALSACSGKISDKSKAERHLQDQKAHREYVETIYRTALSKDCFAYQDLVCD